MQQQCKNGLWHPSSLGIVVVALVNRLGKMCMHHINASRSKREKELAIQTLQISSLAKKM